MHVYFSWDSFVLGIFILHPFSEHQEVALDGMHQCPPHLCLPAGFGQRQTPGGAWRVGEGVIPSLLLGVGLHALNAKLQL